MTDSPAVNDSVNSGVDMVLKRIRTEVYVDGPPHKVGRFMWEFRIADGLFSYTDYAATQKRAERKAQKAADKRTAQNVEYEARRELSRLRRAAHRELADE